MADRYRASDVRFVLLDGDHILCTDWTWIALDYLLRRRGGKPIAVWVFGSSRAADRARRSYGRGRWRTKAIVRV